MFSKIRAVVSEIDGHDCILVLGLVLIGVGLWSILPGVALASVGAVLVWIALPARPPFLKGR